MPVTQGLLFSDAIAEPSVPDGSSSTFVKNMSLPVHRWFRYSAGFSAAWVEQVIREQGQSIRLFDPFAGSGTTLIAAEKLGVESLGIDSHPFVSRIAQAKLDWRSDIDAYGDKIRQLRTLAKRKESDTKDYPSLIHNCYDTDALNDLDALRQAYLDVEDDSAASRLAWLTLISILRKTSSAGTAQWQYILPKKQKLAPRDVFSAFDETARVFRHDMALGQGLPGPKAVFLQTDAKTCAGVPSGFNLVITSPPYPNNYDYADATRLEMSFMREIAGWGDLHAAVRRHLVCSCSQHVPERAVQLDEVLASEELRPIASEIRGVCDELGEVRKTKGGKKTYHLMIACYFRDLAQVWNSLRRVCDSGATVCFVIGDSAPYGVYVPVIPWLGSLAQAAGFKSYRFERTRARNVKWKNRKHRVPLQEGRLWVEG
jgi:DNA modification methylase